MSRCRGAGSEGANGESDISIVPEDKVSQKIYVNQSGVYNVVVKFISPQSNLAQKHPQTSISTMNYSSHCRRAARKADRTRRRFAVWN